MADTYDKSTEPPLDECDREPEEGCPTCGGPGKPYTQNGYAYMQCLDPDCPIARFSRTTEPVAVRLESVAAVRNGVFRKLDELFQRPTPADEPGPAEEVPALSAFRQQSAAAMYGRAAGEADGIESLNGRPRVRGPTEWLLREVQAQGAMIRRDLWHAAASIVEALEQRRTGG